MAGLAECYREIDLDDKSESKSDQDEKTRDREGGRSGSLLICRFCHGPITTRGDAVEIEGQHEHTFFNPAGVLFEIGCFGSAPGCRISGIPTTEFAWFKGFFWQYSSCIFCDAHLGWYFSSGGRGFYGLITNRLIEKEREEQ